MAVDASRQPVPLHLEPVFEGRQRLVDWASRLSAIGMELAAFDGQEWAAQLGDPVELKRQLEAVRARVLQAAPFCICGCAGRADCPICDGKQWLSAGEYLQALPSGQPDESPECSSGSRH